MKTTTLTAAMRSQIGKRFNKLERREGRTLAVVYDNSNATHITVDAKEVRPVVYTAETFIINLDLDGEKMDVIVRDVQFDPVKETIQHIDFLRVHSDKPVVLTLPVRLEGTPKGVIVGGRLMTKMRRIKVKGIPEKLPDSVNIDVSDLELGGTIKLSEVAIEGLQVMTSPSTAIASVEIPRSLRSAAARKDKE